MSSSMKNQPSGSQLKRLIALAIALFFCFSLLVVQFYTIQIIEADKWRDKAQKQHYFLVTEPFMRGIFYSSTAVRKGHPEKLQPLVADVQKYHLHIDPLSMPPEMRSPIAGRLLSILGIDAKNRMEFLSHFVKNSRNRRVAKWLDPEVRALILKWWQPFARQNKIPSNALFFLADYQRSYPFGKFLGQVLHTIQDNKDALTKQGLPTGGLELHFNELLKGKEGKRRLMRSPRRYFETGEVIEAPAHGADIYLTIDHCLQSICEEEIEKGVVSANAKGGWAVMMNPCNGDILALAQYPFFSPADYRRYFNDKTLIEHTHVKAITDANEPASVTKAFTVAIALMANEELKKKGEPPLFNPEEMMAVSDGRFPGRNRPIKDTRLHRYLNMDMAIQKSSNIYVARLIERVIQRLGNEWYRKKLIDVFGLGLKTGIELPAESPGVLPKPGRKYVNGKLEWSVPTPFSLAMGYNLLANTLQITRAFCIFANGGRLIKPALIRKIVRNGPDGSEECFVDHTAKDWQSDAPQVLPGHIVDRVVKSMKYVTKPGGGAARADVAGYTELGKTGTAKKIVNGEYSNASYCASFVGFTPVKNPAFVLMIVIDEPDTALRPGVGHTYYGSVSASPVFKLIAQRALEYLGIPQDDPCGFPSSDPRCDPKKADWAGEALLLKEKYEKWNN